MAALRAFSLVLSKYILHVHSGVGDVYVVINETRLWLAYLIPDNAARATTLCTPAAIRPAARKGSLLGALFPAYNGPSPVSGCPSLFRAQFSSLSPTLRLQSLLVPRYVLSH